MTDTDRLAAMFKALGDPMRLRIFAFLSSCCSEVTVDSTGAVRKVAGPTVGDVCCHVTGIQRVTSGVSFHLKALRQAGLIQTQRRGKHIVCLVDRDAVQELLDFLGLEPDGCPASHGAPEETRT